MKRLLIAAVVTAAGALAGGATAGEWPGYMGPKATGVADGEKVTKDWSTPPKELWTVKVGQGFASPAVVGGKVYLLDRDGATTEKFRVFDLATGKEEWSSQYDAAPYKGMGYGQTRGTPAIDGDTAYTIGVTGVIKAWDLKEHKAVWEKSLGKDYGAVPGGWGFATSPVVMGDLLVIDTPGSGKSGVVAVDKKTGETRWASEPFGSGRRGGGGGGGMGADTYTTPQVVTLAGVEHILCWHKGTVAGVGPKDGKILWKYDWKTDRPIPNPVVLPGDKVFLTIGYGGGCSLIKVEKQGDALAAKEIFNGDNRSGSKVSPAIFYDGYIYTVANDIKKGLQCIDPDGKVKWTGPGQGTLGSLLIADGVIYSINGDNGGLTMVEASPNGYKELGSIKPLGGKDVWAPMAISDGKLVIRDQSQMKCLDVGAK